MESETKEVESSAKARALAEALNGVEDARRTRLSLSLHLMRSSSRTGASRQFTGAPLMTPALKGVHKKEHADINRGATANCANKDNERGGGGGGG